MGAVMTGITMKSAPNLFWLGLALATALPALDRGALPGNPEFNLSGQNRLRL